MVLASESLIPDFNEFDTVRATLSVDPASVIC